MGDVEKTVKILFQGDDETGSAVKSIKKSLDGLEDAARNVGSGLEDIGAPFADAVEDVALLEAAILAIAAAGLKARSDLEGEARKMGDALGFPTEKAEEFEGVAKRVYSSGFGGDIAESFGAVTLAAQKFKEETSDGIEAIVTNANKIKDTFGTDVSESLAAVKTLMDNFGLSSEQAFDFIVAGYQKGLNGSGDFLESINEYSTQFYNGGADAGQFFSVLESGFQEGLLGTDKAADAFKEFRVRIQDGSTTTQEALDQLGLGESFLNSLATGEITAVEAFNTVIQKLNETDDSSIIMQAGVGLLGTKFEDLGTKAGLSLSTTSTRLDDLAGKIDSINPDEKLGVKFESMMKTITTAIISDDVWKGIESDLGEIFEGFKENFVEAWESLDSSDFDGLLKSFDDLMGSVSEMFGSADIDLTTVEGIKSAIQDVIDTVKSINNVSSGIVDFVSPIVSAVSDLIRWFNELNPETQELAGYIAAFGAALGTVGTVLAAGGAVIGGISTLVGALSSGGALFTGLGAIITLLSGPVGLAAALGIAGAAVIDFSMSNATKELDQSTAAINEEIKILENLNDQLNALPVEIPTIEIYAAMDVKDYEEAQRLIDEAVAKDRQLKVEAQMEQQEFDDFWSELSEIPNLTEVELKAMVDAGSLSEATIALENVAKDKEVAIKAQADIKGATEELEYFVGDQRFTIEIPVDKADIKDAKEEIEKIPTEKQIEIKLQGEIDTRLAQIEASAKTAEAAFKYTAEVDIAQIEAAAEVSKSAFDSIGSSVVSATESVSSMFGDLAGAFSDGNLTQLQKWNLQDMVEDQQEAQNALIESQIKLTDAQTEYLNKKNEALDSGEASIKIDSTGLEPALEMVMWEIIKKVQVKANEEAADFLLGIV